MNTIQQLEQEQVTKLVAERPIPDFNPGSPREESFERGLLEYPHYTRPAKWRGLAVPEVLTSGNHEKIRRWRRDQAESLTKTRRPDLWARQDHDDDGA